MSPSSGSSMGGYNVTLQVANLPLGYSFMCRFGKETSQLVRIDENTGTCLVDRNIPGQTSLDILYEGRIVTKNSANFDFLLSCPTGTYLRDKTSCIPCPEGAICSGDNNPPLSKQGYSRIGNSVEFTKCFHEGSCLGETIMLDPATCNVGYEGPQCAVCSSGYYYTSRSCQKCEKSLTGARAITLFIIISVGGLFLFYLVTSAFKYSMTGVILLLFQLGGLVHNYSIPFPDSLASMLRLFSNSNFNAETLGVECAFGINYYGKFWFFLLLPFIFVATLVMYIGIAVLYFKYKKKEDSRKSTKLFIDFLMNATLSFLAIIHIPVSESAFTYYTCVSNGNFFK